MSDYGLTDHYVAAVKAKIFSYAPLLPIVDISHAIERFNLPHAAHTLKSVFHDFPVGTVHLVVVNAPAGKDDKYIALLLEEHFFVGIDNGFFSLISDAAPQQVVELPTDKKPVLFPGKTILAPAAAALASGKKLEELGTPFPEIKRLLNRFARISKNQIMGAVVHVDNYGNLLTNISRKEFEAVGKGRAFSLNFSRESITEISMKYNAVEEADCVAVFNSSEMLEIAIYMGDANELLGMHYGSPVFINFAQE